MTVTVQVASGENAIMTAFESIDLTKKGINLTCAPISPADFWIGTSEQPQYMMIERKTFDDFLSSLRSGHLQQQRQRMRSELNDGKCAYIGFILEGEPKYRKNSYRQLDGAIENLIFEHRCFVLYSAGTEHTRDIILDICRKIPQYMQGQTVSNEIAPTPLGLKKKQLETDQFAAQILTLIPGLSSKTATALLCEKKTLRAIAETPLTELKDMKISDKRALGAAMAEKLHQWLKEIN